MLNGKYLFKNLHRVLVVFFLLGCDNVPDEYFEVKVKNIEILKPPPDKSNLEAQVKLSIINKTGEFIKIGRIVSTFSVDSKITSISSHFFTREYSSKGGIITYYGENEFDDAVADNIAVNFFSIPSDDSLELVCQTRNEDFINMTMKKSKSLSLNFYDVNNQQIGEPITFDVLKP